jgi:hypothetical protein
MFGIGLILILVVLFARGGLYGGLERWAARRVTRQRRTTPSDPSSREKPG